MRASAARAASRKLAQAQPVKIGCTATPDCAAAMIATGRIRIAPLISRTLPLDDALDAILNPPRRGEIRAR